MKVFFVDSFTDTPFKGNPAAVCFADRALDDAQMQGIATEIGFSETAFVRAAEQADAWQIRYFSPKKEIPLCGHATLAAGKIILSRPGKDQCRFITGAGVVLPVENTEKGIRMEFPVYDTVPSEVPEQLLRAMGVESHLRSVYSPNNKIILVEIDGTEKLAALRPDFNAMVAAYGGINGVLVTAAGTGTDFDFHYRYFWPWAGTDEDPVTGGVQTFLTKYWSARLGKTEMHAFQSSARTGMMHTSLRGDKVHIYGRAVVILEGELNV